MEKFENRQVRVALAGLDLTEMDDHIIRYAALITKMLPIERVFFVHVAQNLELPEEVMDKYPDLLAPLDESIENDVRQKIDKHFGSSEVETTILIKEGNPIQELLKLSRIKDVDMMMMGRKQSLKGSGIVSSHIARKSPCTLLLVPENGKYNLQKVVVAVDYSRHSILALDCAHEICKNGGAELHLANAYSVPVGFYKTGKSYEEFANIMMENAENHADKMLRQLGLTPGYHCHYLLAERGNYVDPINDFCHEVQADLIVVGSKGRTDASAILMGSLAEKLTFKDNDIPLLIVKRKGENMKFLDTLMRI